MSISGISETKLNEKVWSSESELVGYDLLRLYWSRRSCGVALKVWLRTFTKLVFALTQKVLLLICFCQVETNHTGYLADHQIKKDFVKYVNDFSTGTGAHKSGIS